MIAILLLIAWGCVVIYMASCAFIDYLKKGKDENRQGE
jgi:hypothetical protein